MQILCAFFRSFLWDFFALYSVFMSVFYREFDESKAKTPKQMTTLEILKRVKIVRSQPLFFGFSQRLERLQRYWFIRFSRHYQEMPADLGSLDLHANGKALRDFEDIVFQLMDVVLQKEMRDYLKRRDEWFARDRARRNGDDCDRHTHGRIATGPRRANQHKAKQARTQRGKK